MSNFCPDPKTKTYQSKFPKNLVVTPGHKHYPNPGSISNIHRNVIQIWPDFFDGIELGMKKALAPNKTLVTSWILSHTVPSGFRIGGIYSFRYRDNILETPTIECDINPSTFTSNFNFTYYPFSSLKIESRFQHLGNENLETVGLQNMTSLEFTRPSSTITLCSYNPKMEASQFTVSYLGSVTKKLALGYEIFFECLNRDLITKVALAARYNKNNRVIAATISQEAVDISYWRQIHKSIQMGTFFAFNRCTQKAFGNLCYQYDFDTGTRIRGMLDSDWSVGFLYESSSSTMPSPCILGFSLKFCAPTNRFTLGLQLNFDPSTRCNTKEKNS